MITAARDAGPYLSETLDSVVGQSFDDWEVVLVDDGSEDDTAAIARGYGERVRVLRNERPLGPAGARNIGIDNARGELIATLDSDDMWTPRYLESQVALYDQAVARGRPVGVICCDARLLGPNGLKPETFGDRLGRTGGVVTLTDLLQANIVFTSVLAPRSVLRSVGGYDHSLVGVEDYDLWVRLAEEHREIVWNPEVLAIHRLRPGSLASRAELQAEGTARVYELALARGRLDRRQRRIARRQRRLHRLLARRARIAAARSHGERQLGPRLALLPVAALVAFEHPDRWPSWVRQGGPRRRAPADGLR